MSIDSNQELKMTYTSVVNKNGKPFISLAFERDKDYCEGSVPDCAITNNRGFSDEEVSALELYLRINKKQIIEDSKNISGIMKIFREN